MTSATAAYALELVTQERLSEVLTLLASTHTPAGSEEWLASELRDWGGVRAGKADWRVQPVAPGSANLIATYPAGRSEPCEVMFYTHLDTSLTGKPELDFPLTAVSDPPPPFSCTESEAVGTGLAVSKAPAACALTAFVAVVNACEASGSSDHGRLGILLSAGGTHRAPSGGFALRPAEGVDQGLGIGVETALRLGERPSSVINVKGGASGVLSEEPGCLLVRLELRDKMAPVPNRGSNPGAAVRAARVAQAVEAWRGRYSAARRGLGREIAADAGVGAIEAGLPFKPDILPAAANVYVYVVTLPDEDIGSILADLEADINEAMLEIDPGWSLEMLHLHIYGCQPGATTGSDSKIVCAARSAWEATFGSGSAEVRDYTGSTDGVIFRREGIDTVRLGVTARANQANPSIDAVSFAEMLAVTRVYVDTVARVL